MLFLGTTQNMLFHVSFSSKLCTLFLSLILFIGHIIFFRNVSMLHRDLFSLLLRQLRLRLPLLPGAARCSNRLAYRVVHRCSIDKSIPPCLLGNWQILEVCFEDCNNIIPQAEGHWKICCPRAKHYVALCPHDAALGPRAPLYGPRAASWGPRAT